MELAFLKPLERPGPWASVYVDTSRTTEDGAKQYEMRRRYVGARLTDQGVDARTRNAVLDRLAAEPVSGAPPGRALFAADGEVVLDVPLTNAPMGTIETFWGLLPRVTPLLTLRGDEPPCLVAYIDHTGADLERRDGYGAEPTGQAQGERSSRGHRSMPGDRHEWHYRNKQHNQCAKTAEIIASEIAGRFPLSDTRLLVLSGEPGERAAVRDRLPEPLRDVTVEIENGSRSAKGAGRLLEEIEHVRHAYARRHLGEVLDLFHAGRGRPGEHGEFGPGSSRGVAADGVPAVVEAARSHQVATLLMRETGPDLQRQVWIGPEPEQVGVQRNEVRAMGVREPQTARADDALMRAAIAADAEALLVPDGLPGPAGGIGAVLRWRVMRAA